MPELAQSHDDPAGFIWIPRAVGQTNKSRDWIENNCTVYQQGRRAYVKIEDLRAALSRAETPQVKSE